MEGSNFNFDSVNLLYYSLRKISLNRSGSYIDSPSWKKHKRASINPKNKDNKSFRDATMASLKHEKIENHPERRSNLESSFDQYNWKGIEFPSHSKDWTKFEQSNNTVVLDILYVPYNSKQIRPGYISKYNYKRDNQVILLTITNDGKKWHYHAVKSTSALLREITSNHNEDFYCLNCFHSYKTIEKLKKHETVYKYNDYCYVKMLNEDEKILKYSPGEKWLKVPFMIYADLECLIRKIDSCQNDPKKSSTA